MMKTILSIMIILMMIGLAAATPLDAVKSAPEQTIEPVNLMFLNATPIFSDVSMQDDIGNSNALNYSNNIDTDLSWHSGISDWMNTTQ